MSTPATTRMATGALIVALALAACGGPEDNFDQAKSTVTVEPATVQADGTASALVTVTIRNGAGSPMNLVLVGPNDPVGLVITLTPSANGTTFSAIGGEAGVYTARVWSTSVGSQTVTASLKFADSAVATLAPASVTFVAAVAVPSPSPTPAATPSPLVTPSPAPATAAPIATRTATPATAAPTTAPSTLAPTAPPTAAPPTPSLPPAQGGYIVTSGFVTRQVGFACQSDSQTTFSASTLGRDDGVGLVLGEVLGPNGQPMHDEVRILTIGASGQAWENRGSSPPHCFRILGRFPDGTIATGAFRADVYVGATVIKTYTFTVTP